MAEFESDVTGSAPGRVQVAKAKGHLRGKQPNSAARKPTSSRWFTAAITAPIEVAEPFGVGRSTVYRAIERQRVEARAGLAGATSRH